MKFCLSQKFIFEAAHTLSREVPVDEYKKSTTIHGHTYQAEIFVLGNLGSRQMLTIPGHSKKQTRTIDLFVIRQTINEIKQKLDHSFLDELLGENNGTLEKLCFFIAEEASKRFPVFKIEVSRQTGDKCSYMPSGINKGWQELEFDEIDKLIAKNINIKDGKLADGVYGAVFDVMNALKDKNYE